MNDPFVNGQTIVGNETTQTSTEPAPAAEKPSPTRCKHSTLLRMAIDLLRENRAGIVQVIGDLAKENHRLHDQEVERHFRDPIARTFISIIARWRQEAAVADGQAKRANTKAIADVLMLLRDGKEIDIAELYEELRRLGYDAFVDPVGTPFNCSRHCIRERVVARKRKQVGRVARVLRPGYLKPDGSILQRQWIALWTSAHHQA